jgi:ring-1,2-phenylacetyl-CoA epoxidase subunit PaaA
MYGNAYIDKNEKMSAEADDPIKLEEFEARIARGEKIEPDDWMPSDYRKQLIRMIEQHAHSEIMGALPEGTWITRAPNFRRKLALIAKVQDEVGHGHLLYAAAETLGKSREEMVSDMISGKSKYSNIFNYPAKSWADIAVIGFLVDAGAIINQLANAKGSYGPYCRALERICYEESFHLKQGYDAFVALATGTPRQREMLQDAVNRWWPPMMHFFGPPDKLSVHTERLMRWKVKMASNEDMRQEFIEQYVPKIWELGITLPDPMLKKNEESGVWEYTEPDWDEFFKVINGGGPCNAERIAVRKYAEQHGRWVREALMNPTMTQFVPYA